MPALAKACIETWKHNLPDYELIKWDETNCPKNDFVIHHLERENWAFVADYVRLHALHEQGGIYLDTDIEVVKKFDDLLEQGGFLGYESHGRVNNAVAGASPGNYFFKDCMEHILNRFHNDESYEISPVVTTQVLAQKQYDIQIYPEVYFYPYNPYDEKRDVENLMFSMITSQTYAIHHWAKSWNHSVDDVKVHITGVSDVPKCTLCKLANRLCQKICRIIKRLVR
jgi:mannosyltransferase OCH1-like enzyme